VRFDIDDWQRLNLGSGRRVSVRLPGKEGVALFVTGVTEPPPALLVSHPTTASGLRPTSPVPLIIAVRIGTAPEERPAGTGRDRASEPADAGRTRRYFFDARPSDTERTHRRRQNYSTFPQSLMVTLADVFPLGEPTASIFLTTS
jgi:hypothetical protein